MKYDLFKPHWGPFHIGFKSDTNVIFRNATSVCTVIQTVVEFNATLMSLKNDVPHNCEQAGITFWLKVALVILKRDGEEMMMKSVSLKLLQRDSIGIYILLLSFFSYPSCCLQHNIT